jgi:hypothetical protein
MESKQSRRRFLKQCAEAGGTCCVLLACARHLPAQESPEKNRNQTQKPIDFNKLSYCGIPCVQVCPLYKATQENDVKMKKILYERQEMKKSGLEFDPDKVFCYTCKPGDKPKKVGMDQCLVRHCASANGVESCVQCRDLSVCAQEYWKKWPGQLEFTKKLQARYIKEPGAALKENKAGK